jgi:hypothetical protein
MPIKITKTDEVIEVGAICVTIYSQPGLGKTSLAYTTSRPLLLDFDKGAYRAVFRKDVVQVTDWSDVAGIKKDDVAEYDTIIIDTAGKALDALAQDILRKNSKLGYAGALNQQGWGQLGVQFGAFLRLLRSFGKDVILIAHMDEQKDGDTIKERLKISGGSKDLILTDSDAIGRISIIARERHLIFSPTETSFGKDPAGLESAPIPDATSPAFETCMAEVITAIKGKLNALGDGEKQWFAQALPNVKDADGINALLSRAKKAGREVGKMVVARANDLGLHFDPDKREYVYIEQAQDEAMDEGEAA